MSTDIKMDGHPMKLEDWQFGNLRTLFKVSMGTSFSPMEILSRECHALDDLIKELQPYSPRHIDKRAFDFLCFLYGLPASWANASENTLEEVGKNNPSKTTGWEPPEVGELPFESEADRKEREQMNYPNKQN